MRHTVENAAQLCGCKLEMQKKITEECIRWYDLEIEDPNSVYMYIDTGDCKERFTSFIWILKRFGGDINMINSIVYYFSYYQFLRYGDMKTAGVSYSMYKDFSSRLDAEKLAELESSLEIDENSKAGWR